MKSIKYLFYKIFWLFLIVLTITSCQQQKIEKNNLSNKEINKHQKIIKQDNKKSNEEIYIKSIDQKINANKETFQILSSPHFIRKPYQAFYAKDKNFVYFSSFTPGGFSKVTKIKEADPNSFEFFGDRKTRFTKDKKNIFYENQKINADKETFQILSYRFAKDKNYLFRYTKKINEVDINTFEILSSCFVRDKNNIFYFYNDNEEYIILKDIDVKTFKIIDNRKISDKNGIYSCMYIGFYVTEKEKENYLKNICKIIKK